MKMSYESSSEVIKGITDGVIIELALRDEHSDDMEAIAEALKRNESVTAVSIHMNDLSSKAAKSLGEALEYSTKITSFHLWLNNIESESAKHLSEALAKNISITTVTLPCYDLAFQEANHLPEALKVNTSITSIDLWYGGTLSLCGVMNLSEALKANKNITSVALRGGDLGREGFRYIAEALEKSKTIIKVTLNHNKIGEHDELLRNLIQTSQSNLGRFHEQCGIVLKNGVSEAMKDIPVDERQPFIFILKEKLRIAKINSQEGIYYQNIRTILEANRTFHLLSSIGISYEAMEECGDLKLPNELISIISKYVDGDIALRNTQAERGWTAMIIDEEETEQGNVRGCKF